MVMTMITGCKRCAWRLIGGTYYEEDPHKDIAVFVGGTLTGSAGIRLLSGKDARRFLPLQRFIVSDLCLALSSRRKGLHLMQKQPLFHNVDLREKDRVGSCVISTRVNKRPQLSEITAAAAEATFHGNYIRIDMAFAHAAHHAVNEVIFNMGNALIRVAYTNNISLKQQISGNLFV